VRAFGEADALRLAFVGEAGFVGSLTYYRTSRVDGEHDVSTLWLSDSGDSRQVAGVADAHSPSPAPDGRSLAFVASADGVPQIWLTGTDGAARQLTKLVQGVTGAPAWAPSGQSVAFTARDGVPPDRSLPYRVIRPTFRYDGIGLVEDAVRDVYLADAMTGAVRRLTSDGCVYEDPRWSPDGQRILVRASFEPADREWTAKPSLYVIDVASGNRQLVVGDWGGVLEAEWCPDGERIAFYGIPAVPGYVDAYFHRRDVWTVEATGGTPVCRTAALPAGVGVKLDFDHPTWHTFRRANLRVAGGDAYVSAQRGGDVGICRVALSGPEATEFVVEDPQRVCFLSDLDPSTDRLLYVATSALDPPDLYLREQGTEQRLTDLNGEALRGIARGRLHTIEVTAADGLQTDAWALTPAGAGPFPTVLAIHGGPSNSVGNVYTIDHQLLVGAGIAVVFGNFRGSFGYGTEYMRLLHGRWGQEGEQDHLALIDRAVELGIADPDRLGVYGLSHGGFATCWLVGRTDRFRAAVAENPVTNFVTSYGTMDSPWWIAITLGGRPHEKPDLYAESSPLTYAHNCTTPLLFVVGENDLRCLPLESEQYFRVLSDNGCPTEMLRLPGADHIGSWTGSVPVRAAQNAALVEWFARHLLDD
jgi:dipeptidyl aminopeptidase/acylaminoacyl peptidase